MKILSCVMIGIFRRVNTPLITNFHTSIQIHSINQPNDFRRISAGQPRHSLRVSYQVLPRLRINRFGFTNVSRVRDILGFTNISRVRNTFKYMFCPPPLASSTSRRLPVTHDPPARPNKFSPKLIFPPACITVAYQRCAVP